MRKNPAFEIPAELAFDMGWTGSALAAVAGEFEPSGEVRLHGAMEHGTVERLIRAIAIRNRGYTHNRLDQSSRRS